MSLSRRTFLGSALAASALGALPAPPALQPRARVATATEGTGAAQSSHTSRART